MKQFKIGGEEESRGIKLCKQYMTTRVYMNRTTATKEEDHNQGHISGDTRSQNI
jgi:hypothetical protein